MRRRYKPEHGMTAYKNGCRCNDCRRANAEYSRRYRMSETVDQILRLPTRYVVLIGAGSVECCKEWIALYGGME